MGLVRLGNEINRVRSVFKFALGNGLIAKPMLFGTEFKKPEESEVRGERIANGKKQSLTPDEIHRLLDAADVQMKAMLLVAVNAAMGNNDVALLPLDALDLDGGWITYPRPKTKIDRRCPLVAGDGPGAARRGLPSGRSPNRSPLSAAYSSRPAEGSG